MKKILVLIFIVAVIGLGWWYLSNNPSNPSLVGKPNESTNSEEESTVINTSVVITPAPASKIQVESVKSGDKLTSPAIITGRARGPWYFEASFPVELRDSNGTQLAIQPATATSDWMTTDWVPFTVTLTFPTPVTATGTLKFKNDNPSGDPAKDEFYIVEVKF